MAQIRDEQSRGPSTISRVQILEKAALISPIARSGSYVTADCRKSMLLMIRLERLPADIVCFLPCAHLD